MNLSIHQLAIEEVRSRLDTLSAGRPFFARDGYSIQMDVDRPLLGDVLSLMRVPARLSENRIVLVTRGRARFTLDTNTKRCSISSTFCTSRSARLWSRQRQAR